MRSADIIELYDSCIVVMQTKGIYMRVIGNIVAIMGLVVGATACAVESDTPDTGVVQTSDGPARADSLGVFTDTTNSRTGIITDQAFATSGLCFRTPFGPGEVIFNNNPNPNEWRRKPENSSQWIGAQSGAYDTDGIHRNGWGCTVLKVPDYCTLTVSSSNSLSCCCNAALTAADGGCRWVQYNEIGAPRPPGC